VADLQKVFYSGMELLL